MGKRKNPLKTQQHVPGMFQKRESLLPSTAPRFVEICLRCGEHVSSLAKGGPEKWKLVISKKKSLNILELQKMCDFFPTMFCENESFY